jgi:ABC-type sugar transport system substrate-binding protein
MVAPLQADAEKDGYSVTTVDSAGDQGKAIAAIQTFVTKKVNLIFAPVYAPSQISAGLAAAKAAGIPVVGMGGGTGPGMPISWDYVRAAGNEIATRIVKDSGGSGQLLEVTDTSFPVCQIRGQELAAALKPTSVSPDVQQMQSSDITGSSESDTNAWLQKHPKGSGGDLIVWACADSIATGVITAVKSGSRTDVAVYSMGGELPELEDVQSGLIKADVFVDMAGAGHDLAAQVPAIVAAGVNAAPKEVVIATQVVDAGNVKAFLASHEGQLSQ